MPSSRKLGVSHSTKSGLGWDADGVLLDSRTAAWRAAEDIVALFGERPTIDSPADNAAAFGRAAQAQMTGEEGAPTLRAMHRLLMRARASRVGLFGEVLDIVAALSCRPALITAAYADGVVRALGPRAALFASIVGREAGSKDGLMKAAATAGMTWFVTDTVRDLHRCRACGVAVLAVTWGYDAAEDLVRAGPDILANTPGQLAEALTGLSFFNRPTAAPNCSTLEG